MKNGPTPTLSTKDLDPIPFAIGDVHFLVGILILPNHHTGSIPINQTTFPLEFIQKVRFQPQIHSGIRHRTDKHLHSRHWNSGIRSDQVSMSVP